MPPRPDGPAYAGYGYQAGPGYGAVPGYAGGPAHPGPDPYRPGQPAAGYPSPGHGHGAGPEYGRDPGYGAGPGYAGDRAGYGAGPGYAGDVGAPGYRPDRPPGPGAWAGPQAYAPPVYPGPVPAAGQGAYPGPAPEPVSYQPLGGYPVADGYQGPHGHPVPGDYPGTDGHAGPAGYGETDNGGYAYVIRQGEEFGPRPDPLAGSDPSTFVYRDAGGDDEPGEPEAAEPGVPYGPDDPAYGPPSPGWYAREDDEEARQQAAVEELRYTRGPFEPPPPSGASAEQAASYQGAGYGHLGDDHDDDPGAPGDRALEQIKDLYLTAEAIGAENLDRHFGQLLERQRQLISEYFTEADAGDHRAATGLQDLNGMNGMDSGRLAFGTDQRSPR